MEYIEGETLSERLQKGPLAIGDLLRYSIQIADALDKAHRKGIIHRDLKPGNIILTKSGVKVLDFGLAKIAEQKPAAGVSQRATEHQLTREGTILGTIQYMAPEQLEAKETDARTDIFAFGAVMYEMATGKKAFEGSSQASLIAAILKEEPKPLSQIQPLTPPILERLVKTCLAKDPEDRWQSAQDISNELRWISESSGSQTAVSIASAMPKLKSGRMGWIVAGALAVALIAGSLWTGSRFFGKQASETSEIRFWIPPSPGATLEGTLLGIPDFAVSHDGKHLVYSASDSAGNPKLWLRPLAAFNAQPIRGTENAEIAFWSPDDQQIAFNSEDSLKKLALTGGAPQRICSVPEAFNGGVWLVDGTIIFGLDDSGLMRVSANGGQPQPLTTLDPVREERAHTYPVLLPDGRHFLYTIDSNKAEERAVYMGSLDSKDTFRIVDSRYKVNYIEPGFLLFLRGASLVAQRLQMDPPKLVGDPVQVADDLSVNSAVSNAPFTSSLNGTILYRGGDTGAKTQLAWFDRNGKPLGAVGSVESDVSVTLSPDGTRAAVASETGPSFRSATGEASVNIWVIDLARSVRTRITFDPSISDENPTWSPDGRFLTFASHRKSDRAEVFKKSSSGEGKDQLVYSGDGNEHPIDWSPDGKFLLSHSNGNRMDLVALPLSSGVSKPIPFVSTSLDDAQGQFSPDGRWVAYTSVESGRNEVYVRPFPNGDGKWQISPAGGSEPRWRSDGKELFYLTPDGTLMSVTVKTGSTLEASPPAVLFKTGTLPIDTGAWGGAAQYDVSNDGSRFLINTIVVPPTPPNLYVIVNWKPPASQK